MILTCYGTAAAEAIPALYCSCTVCEEARQLGGREVRARHMSTVDQDIQFDFGPDALYYIQSLGYEPRATRHLVYTHHHGDHCQPGHLELRREPYALVREHDLKVYGSARTVNLLRAHLDEDLGLYGMTLVVLSAFETVHLDAHTRLTPLPAHHADPGDAFLYLLERRGSKLLYAHDTGLFPEATYQFLAGQQLDALSLDCTGVYHGAGDHHMTLEDCQQVVQRLKQTGAAKPRARVLLNHFSHGGGATHHQLEEEAAARGWTAAYDGLRFEV